MAKAQGTVDEQARAWFLEEGHVLDEAALRAELERRGTSRDLVIELVDDLAERHAAAAVVAATTAEQTGDRAEAAPGAAPNGRRRRGATSRSPGNPSNVNAPVPPQHPEAEEHVLGAMLLAPAAIDAAAAVLDASDFFRDSHARIYRAALELHATGSPVDAITLTAELERRGELDQVGGRTRVQELARLVPATANTRHYAEIVRETATLRGLIRAGGEIAQLGWDREGDIGELVARAQEIAAQASERSTGDRTRDRLVPGGRFILDGADELAAIWGDGDDGILWTEGEGLMICGPQGVGKTTLMQQLALARCGLLHRVLGLDVQPAARRVLYLAADRPAQARRSMSRMVADHNRDELDGRLVVHPGPPDYLVDQDPRYLLRLCQQAGADTLFVDSVKDVCLKPSDEESAAYANLAWQYVVGAGVELVLGHHQRKGTDGNRKPTKLDDVYGNQRLYSGLGSIVLLWGEAGDPVVEFSHLKQPSEEVLLGHVLHEHAQGISRVDKPPDVLDVLGGANGAGMTADDVAALVYRTEKASRNQTEKIRQRLKRLGDRGRVDVLAGDPQRFRIHIPGVS